MGDPKYPRKISARPRNPWQRNLLKEGFLFKYNELNKALDQIYNQ